jgi:DNA-binding transcriptional ArsR family regulator
MEDMLEKAGQVSAFVKGIAHRTRLLILCQLVQGERNVTELMEATGIAQTSMSQHLAKLKAEGIVDYRREHKHLYYYICHDAARDLMAVLYDHFCNEEGK